VQPVGRRVSVKWPASMPATSVIEIIEFIIEDESPRAHA
jgi:hypothetical protein